LRKCLLGEELTPDEAQLLGAFSWKRFAERDQREA